VDVRFKDYEKILAHDQSKQDQRVGESEIEEGYCGQVRRLRWLILEGAENELKGAL